MRQRVVVVTGERRSCPGSQQPPKGQPMPMPGRQLPRGICAHCYGVYAVRTDGTLLLHRL